MFFSNITITKKKRFLNIKKQDFWNIQEHTEITFL